MVFLHGCTHYPTWIPIHVQLQSFVLNVHHKHQWFSQHYVFHVISLQPCGWVNTWDPFNSICENQFIPMSYVWLYCIDILMSGNCQWLSIKRYHTPTSPQIQSMISCTSSPKNSLLVSSEVYPPVSLEVWPLAYFEVCLLYQSVFCDFSLDKGCICCIA